MPAAALQQVGSIDLSEHVRSIAELLAQARPKKVSLDLDLAEGLPLVEADGAQLQQVTMNLVLNAAEAVGDGTGRVEVATGRGWISRDRLVTWLSTSNAGPGDYVWLRVTDDGKGMDDRLRQSIFDPFFTTKAHGHGLGLSAVLGMVKGHSGGIAVDSVPGRGTTFTVYLPISRTGATVSRTPSRAPTHPGQGRILVADDERGLRRYLRRMLRSAGYEVLEARDGVEALELIAVEPVDLVVLDLNMPRAGGEEVLDLLRTLRPELPILLSSGDDSTDLAHRIGTQTGVAFVAKPFRQDQMLEQIGKLLS